MQNFTRSKQAHLNLSPESPFSDDRFHGDGPSRHRHEHQRGHGGASHGSHEPGPRSWDRDEQHQRRAPARVKDRGGWDRNAEVESYQSADRISSNGSNDRKGALGKSNGAPLGNSDSIDGHRGSSQWQKDVRGANEELSRVSVEEFQYVQRLVKDMGRYLKKFVKEQEVREEEEREQEERIDALEKQLKETSQALQEERQHRLAQDSAIRLLWNEIKAMRAQRGEEAPSSVDYGSIVHSPSIGFSSIGYENSRVRSRRSSIDEFQTSPYQYTEQVRSLSTILLTATFLLAPVYRLGSLL